MLQIHILTPEDLQRVLDHLAGAETRLARLAALEHFLLDLESRAEQTESQLVDVVTRLIALETAAPPPVEPEEPEEPVDQPVDPPKPPPPPDHTGHDVQYVPPGLYSWSELLVKKTGSADRRIIYRPEPDKPGSVVIRGGKVDKLAFVTCDGFTYDSTKHPDFTRVPPKAFGIDVWDSQDVEFANGEVIGPNDYFTGFNVTGTESCSESDGGLNASNGLTSRAGTQDVVFRNLVVHGFYGAGSLSGESPSLIECLVRHNFNGFSVTGAKVLFQGGVFWMNPNHLFSLKGAGEVMFYDNLAVDAQDMIQAGPNWDGAQKVTAIHNTFYTALNNPCYGMSGITVHSVAQTILRDNLLMNRKGDKWIQAKLGTIINSDYNGFGNYTPATDEFKLWREGGSDQITLEVWRERTGQDHHSRRLMPQFVNAPQYTNRRMPIPHSVVQTRSWFHLVAGSPGSGVASDGLDLGILR